MDPKEMRNTPTCSYFYGRLHNLTNNKWLYFFLALGLILGLSLLHEDIFVGALILLILQVSTSI